MSKQLKTRLSSDVVALVLAKFNAREISADEACVRLGVGRSRLYVLRTRWLRNGAHFQLGTSGGDTTGGWPESAEAIAERLVIQASHQGGEPVNYALIADCILCETGIRKSRTAVMRHCRQMWPLLCLAPKPPRPVKRWSTACAGALWQVDSTPVHLFGEDGEMQHLIAIVDDATREILCVLLVESDSVLSEMSAFRTAVAVHGLPSIVYTDGFTIFGHEGEDINTAYGRMCAAFGVTHLVAPTPQAKGKIERHMRTLQHRVRTLVLDAIASAGVTDLEGAAPVIARHIAFWNENHVNRTTGLTPRQAYERCVAERKTEYRPAPSPALMDLFLARHEQRAVTGGNRIQYMGRTFEIGPTARKRVWLVIQSDEFHVVEEDPLAHRDRWPLKLGTFRL